MLCMFACVCVFISVCRLGSCVYIVASACECIDSSSSGSSNCQGHASLSVFAVVVGSVVFF